MMDLQESGEAGEEEAGGERKWLCEYCTYENWPSCTKCTMCRGSRPLRVIATTQQNIYSSTQVCRQNMTKNHNLLLLQATHDIYRLSSPPLHSSPPPQLPDTGEDNDDGDVDDGDVEGDDDDGDDDDDPLSTPPRPRNCPTQGASPFSEHCAAPIFNCIA